MDDHGNLNEELLKLKAAVEASDDAIFITDLTGIITYINPGFTSLYGFSPDEIIGNCTPRVLKSGYMKPEDYEYFWNTLLKKEPVSGEIVNKSKSGNLISVEGSSNAILNEKGDIIGFICLQHDISARKKADEALRQSEEKFRKAFMTIPDAVSINRISDGMFVTVNEGFSKITGYTNEDVSGKTSIELNIWADKENGLEIIRILETGGRAENYEALFRHKNGTLISALTSASIINFDGEPHILAITRDITKRRKIEKALAQEQFLVNALLNTLPDHIYFKDMESRFIRNSKSHSLSFGFDNPENLKGKSDFDFFTKEAAQMAYNDEQEIIKTGKIISKEEKLTRKDGTDAWFHAMKLPLVDDDMNIVGTFGISKDITQRKRIELLNSVIYEITQGITTTSNLDQLLKLVHKSLSKVVYAENIFVALYERDTDMFSFPYFVDKFDVVPPPTAMKKSCTSYVFRTGKPLLLSMDKFNELVEQGEVVLVGSNAPSWVGIPLPAPSGTIGVLVLQHYEAENVYRETDLDFLSSIGSQIAIAIDRKINEEELSSQNILLQKTIAEKDRFFSILAHDLRGPLSSFVSATQILSEDIRNMTLEEIGEISLNMKDSATNIYTLLENLLEWSRLQRGTMEFTPERFNPGKEITDCIKVLLDAARKKEIELTISVDDNLEIVADRHMFATIVRNLVSNAIKFSRNSGKVEIAVIPSDTDVLVKVIDSGIGIPDEIKNKLFTLDGKTKRKGTDGESSSGLGLLICKEFVEKHNGILQIESEAGKGSTFSFTLIR
jgi:PAS domain S-box-containing protein